MQKKADNDWWSSFIPLALVVAVTYGAYRFWPQIAKIFISDPESLSWLDAMEKMDPWDRLLYVLNDEHKVMTKSQGQGPPQGDPDTGFRIDPNTGLLIDPQSGQYYDPNTMQPVDPQTGQPVDPDMQQDQMPVQDDLNMMQGQGQMPPQGDSSMMQQGDHDMAQGQGMPQVDPDTGMQIDPNTGFLIDPQSGMFIDPQSSQMIDPNTMQPVDPDMVVQASGQMPVQDVPVGQPDQQQPQIKTQDQMPDNKQITSLIDEYTDMQQHLEDLFKTGYITVDQYRVATTLLDQGAATWMAVGDKAGYDDAYIAAVNARNFIDDSTRLNYFSGGNNYNRRFVDTKAVLSREADADAYKSAAWSALSGQVPPPPYQASNAYLNGYAPTVVDTSDDAVAQRVYFDLYKKYRLSGQPDVDVLPDNVKQQLQVMPKEFFSNIDYSWLSNPENIRSLPPELREPAERNLRIYSMLDPYEHGVTESDISHAVNAVYSGALRIGLDADQAYRLAMQELYRIDPGNRTLRQALRSSLTNGTLENLLYNLYEGGKHNGNEFTSTRLPTSAPLKLWDDNKDWFVPDQIALGRLQNFGVNLTDGVKSGLAFWPCTVPRLILNGAGYLLADNPSLGTDWWYPEKNIDTTITNYNNSTYNDINVLKTFYGYPSSMTRENITALGAQLFGAMGTMSSSAAMNFSTSPYWALMRIPGVAPTVGAVKNLGKWTGVGVVKNLGKWTGKIPGVTPTYKYTQNLFEKYPWLHSVTNFGKNSGKDIGYGVLFGSGEALENLSDRRKAKKDIVKQTIDKMKIKPAAGQIKDNAHNSDNMSDKSLSSSFNYNMNNADAHKLTV